MAKSAKPPYIRVALLPTRYVTGSGPYPTFCVTVVKVWR